MTNDDLEAAYAAPQVLHLLGRVVSESDPDRAVIEPWAAAVNGPILDVGSGTGRWSGRLAQLGHDVSGLEPVESLVQLSRRTFPGVLFQRGWIVDLAGSEQRWAGILAWYSLIHLDAQQLPAALAILRGVLEDNGTLLMSFFSGPRLMPFEHPVATAYLWPMDAMRRALVAARFQVTDQHWDPGRPHAMISARARSSGGHSSG